MFSFLSSLLGIIPNAFKIGEKIVDLKGQQAQLASDEEKARLQSQIDILEMQQKIVIAEQANAGTRWMRPAFAFAALVYVYKVVIFDTVLDMGRTHPLPEPMEWMVVVIIGALFITQVGHAITPWKR